MTLLVVCLSASDLDQIVEPLRVTCTTKVKANSVKQEFEKQDELKRSAMRAVAALLQIPDAGILTHFGISFLAVCEPVDTVVNSIYSIVTFLFLVVTTKFVSR